jgi:hypothetical protein
MKGKIIPLVADVTSKDDLQRIATQVEQECGYINLLGNNPRSLSSPLKLTNSRQLRHQRTPYQPRQTQNVR